MALLSLVLGSIAGVLICAAAVSASATVGAAAGSHPAQDAPKAAAAIGGSPYLDLLKRYRDGEYEAAVKGMAVLPEGRSADRVFEANWRASGIAVTGEEDPRRASQARQLMLANVWAIAVPAAAALHLETGYSLMLAGTFGPARDHLHVARQLVDHPRFSQVMKIRPDLDEAHARFRRDIYLGVLWALQADQNIRSAGAAPRAHQRRISRRWRRGARARVCTRSIKAAAR